MVFNLSGKIAIFYSDKVWLEKHATEELAKYVKAITGFEPEMTTDKDAVEDMKTVVSVGQNAIANSLLESGDLKLPEDLGDEGFVVKTVKADGKNYLVILGGSPRGTLYAVYHYLESVCKVGFFWDGERIPKIDQLPVENIDIIEKPRFGIRKYLQGCVFGYTTYWWGVDEWKREIDWAAKKKFNVIDLPPGSVVVWKKVWKNFGVNVSSNSLSGPPFLSWASFHKWDMRPPYPESFQNFQAELSKTIIDYARSLGFKVPSPGFIGQMPKEFYEKYSKDHRFIEVSWADFKPPGKFIHPADPLYSKVWKAFMKAYRDRYGTDHLWGAPSYGEMRPGDTPDEQEKIKMNNAKTALEVIKSVDPEATLTIGSWLFVDKEFWPKKDVKAYLDIFPDDCTQIWELWPEFHPDKYKPMYKELEYYFGKSWLMGFLHSYGGLTTLHGDLAGLIKRVKEVASDPKADKCLGISVEPEVIHHNYIFYDLLARLGWNPENIELDEFLRDYAVRRYGEESAAKMVGCLRELVASVYSTDDVNSPLYQLRITEEKLQPDWKPWVLTLSERIKFIPHLRKALEIALEEKDALKDNIMYRHDVIDIARQYLGDLFNLHIVRLYEAFKAGNATAFEKEAATLNKILESQMMLLSSSDYYCLQPILDKAQKLPNAPEDFAERIRDILTVWAGQIIDYARRDYYELIRFYYKPRIDAFLNYLREKLKTGAKEINNDELIQTYSEIEQDFVKKGFTVKKGERFSGTPMEAAEKILKEFS